MFSSDSAKGLSIPDLDVLICGDAKDDRGAAALALTELHPSAEVVRLHYEPQVLKYSIGENQFYVDDLDPLIDVISGRSALVEATTLGLVEVVLCVRAADEIESESLHITYVEPGSYSDERSRGVLHRRDFALTESSQLFSAVPGAAVLLNRGDRDRAVILAGYEGDRFQQLLEQNPVKPQDCHVVYGVPAFNSGWETNAFANTVNELDERKVNSVLFAGATNPLAAYRVIEQLHKGIDEGDAFVIAPIGTKPHGIGAALYACDNEGVGLVYDNPLKKHGRSKNLGQWHLYHPVFK